MPKSKKAKKVRLLFLIRSQYAEYAGDGGGLRVGLGHELHEVGLEAVRGHVEVGAGLQQQLALCISGWTLSLRNYITHTGWSIWSKTPIR